MKIMNPDGSETRMRSADEPTTSSVGRQAATLTTWRSPLQFSANSPISTNVEGEVDFTRPVRIIRGGDAGGDIIIDNCTLGTTGYEGEWHQERSNARGVYAMAAGGNYASISLRAPSQYGLMVVGEITLITNK
jgi:hypothetical protein